MCGNKFFITETIYDYYIQFKSKKNKEDLKENSKIALIILGSYLNSQIIIQKISFTKILPNTAHPYQKNNQMC